MPGRFAEIVSIEIARTECRALVPLCDDTQAHAFDHFAGLRANFLAHLIATRDRLPQTTVLRRETPEAAPIFSKLVRGSAKRLQLVLRRCELLAQSSGFSSCGARFLLRSIASGLQLNLPRLQLLVFADALIALGLGGNPLLLDLQCAPLQIGMKAVNALIGAFRDRKSVV